MSHENTMSPTIIDEMNVEKLHELCENLEKYQCYCHSLCEYVNNPVTSINGSSVPFYILQQFAYDQEKLANIKNPEMTKFVAAIADTACLLGTFPYPPGGLWEVSMTKATTILSNKTIASLAQKTTKDHIKQQLRVAIENHVTSSVKSLLKANEGFFRACTKRQGLSTRHVWTKVNSINVSVIAEDVISRASKRKSKVLEKEDLKKLTNCISPKNKRKSCFPTGGLCFSKNRSGFRFKISGRTDAVKPLPGFFDTRSDLRVKCKMGLLHGTVGFGWIRKSALSKEKTWGMFVHPPTYGY
ncbi:uncharacterized protein LOC117335363 [Pecten maximus]|uniref:uncharacterized protein LOC117335363 n=1 Tax=Pecten maximus TaxID=6579 RepID=UPI0014584D2E|nr:uncharacterized protein LOC117335363 [Pecten maximus]